MSKYLLFFKNSISEAIVYRSHFFMLLVSQIISVFVFVFLWKAIYAEGNQIGGYSLNDLIVYYILSALLSFVIQGIDVAWRVGDEIRLGNITNFILRPVSHFWSTFWIIAGKAFLNLIVVGIIIIPVFFFYPEFFSGDINAIRLAGFIFSIIGALVIFMEFFYLIGLATFWMGDAKGFNFFVRMIMFFLAGNMIPLDLLPKTLSNINNFLPFKFMAWFPIAIWSGKIKIEAEIFFPVLLWILILGIFIKYIYKKGLEKYEGFGA
ncbi:MAG: hypothetical protein A2343_00420 [Candidatus Moranbacteria bacterium RIFOXYB12_FULL_35_8]|nr:MAG: hypothetical protein A2343_00420 [Candidatus Moranbacteria bacterium RIFOXYB12_FULL_35_8]